jgi:hypothetical protein
MKSHKKRLEALEQKHRLNRNDEVVFLDRIGEEWTEEEKEWIRNRHPECKAFIKPLTQTMPYGFERQGEKAVALYKDLVSLVNWEKRKQRMEDQASRARAGGGPV